MPPAPEKEKVDRRYQDPLHSADEIAEPALGDLAHALFGSRTRAASADEVRGWTPPGAVELGAALPSYQIEELIGCGGMGAVFLGLHIELNRRVAIKILPGSLADSDPTFAERFKNEARAMAKFRHSGIVSVFDFGETTEGLLYFVMEYVDGTDLQQILKARGSLESSHALAITSSVLDALDYAHRHGIMHRDIKPANILVDQEGRVKIADFGLAKAFAKADEESILSLTISNVAVGTPDFMAPEALEVGTKVDDRADLYAVGVMLYQMLMGSLPRGAFKLPSELRSEIDPRLDDFLVKAMEPDPNLRHATAAAMRAELNLVLSGPENEQVALQMESSGPSTTILKSTLAIPEENGAEKTQAELTQASVRRGTMWPLSWRTSLVALPLGALLVILSIEILSAGKGMEGRHAGELREFGGIEMVWCPPGKFLMGSPENEAGRKVDEVQHEVTLTKGFWMAKTETSQAQWGIVMGNNPSRFTGADLPVETVSWREVQEWLGNWNNANPLPEGWKWALPTEAQWEYACRAGASGPFGEGSIDEMGWFVMNSGSKTNPVGTKIANAWGLLDMHGNVAEVCADWLGEYPSQKATDPAGPPSGVQRVNRGGGWGCVTACCRSAGRKGMTPESRTTSLGFRVAVVSIGP